MGLAAAGSDSETQVQDLPSAGLQDSRARAIAVFFPEPFALWNCGVVASISFWQGGARS